jgi:hypothetical protein
MKHVFFSDEATFHVSGKVNWHNCWIWGSENPHEVIKHERDTPDWMCGVPWHQIL